LLAVVQQVDDRNLSFVASSPLFIRRHHWTEET